MEGLGSKLLGAMQFAAGGLADTQTAAANAQTLASNARVAKKERDRLLAAKIAESSSYKHFNFNPDQESGALSTVDLVGMANENSALAAEFVNSIGEQVFRYTDENGRLRQGKAAGIALSNRKNEAGEEQYAIEIERDDGKKTKKGRNPPMTEGASARDDDNVMYFTAAELNNMGNNRLWEMKANSAWDNGSKFGRDMAQMTDAVAVQRATERGAFSERLKEQLEAKGTDPEIVRAMLAAAYSAPDTDEGTEILIGLAEDAGVDLDAFFAERKAAEDAEGAEGAEGAEAEAEDSGPSFMDRAKEASGNLHKSLLGAETSNKLQQFGGQLTEGVSGAVRDIKLGSEKLHQGVFGDASDSIRQDLPDEPVADAPPRDPNAPTLSDVKDRVEGVPPVIPAKAPGTFEKNNNTAFRDWVDNGIAAISPQIQGMWQRATGAAPVDSAQSTISPEIMGAPPEVQEAILGEGMSPDERRQTILTAIETGLTKPTGETAKYVADYMINNGFTDPAALSRAPSPEIMNIAYTMASQADVPMADRLKIASSIMNLAQFGDSETSALDMAKLQQARAGDSIAAQRLFFDQQKAEFDLEEKDRTRVNEAWADASGRAEIILKSIPRNKKGFVTDTMSKEGWDEFTQLWKGAKAEPDPVRQAAYQRAVGGAMPDVIMAFAKGEARADLAEWVTGNFQDWWLRAKYRQVTTDWGDLRITYDDKGNAKHLYVITGKGDKAEQMQLNMNQLVGRFTREGLDFMLATIEKTEELKNDEK